MKSPMRQAAANYVAERYLWNSGNFLFHAATMLDEIEERFEPAIAETAKAPMLMQGQAHRLEARRKAFAAKAFPSLRALGCSDGTAEVTLGSDVHCVHENESFTFRSAAFTGSRIPARSRSS